VGVEVRLQPRRDRPQRPDPPALPRAGAGRSLLDRPRHLVTEELLEPGPPPLITDNGHILLIHNAAAKDADGKLIYRAGQALIDPAKPTEELARLTTPFLVPETPEETEGQVNNVVFVEGLVAWRGEWLLYYGQGDAGVGVLHGRA